MRNMYAGTLAIAGIVVSWAISIIVFAASVLYTSLRGGGGGRKEMKGKYSPMPSICLAPPIFMLVAEDISERLI